MDNKDKQYRSFNGTSVITEDSDSRIVEGYAIRFNEESQNLGFYETISRDALSQETINDSDIFALFNHKEDAVLARSRYGEGTLKLELRDDGLFYQFEAPNTQWGNELLEHIKRGEISTSSFAFTIEEEGDKWYREGDKIKRTILKISKLYDVSPTFEGAYLTTTCNARSVQMVDELNKEVDVCETREEPVKEEEPKEKVPEVDEQKPSEEPVEEPITENEEPKEEGDIQEEERKKSKEEIITEITEQIEEIQNKTSQKEEDRKIINNKTKMNTDFSLLKAIRSIANNKPVDEITQAVITAGKEEMRKSGINIEGQIQIPLETRAAITVASEGEDVVATDLYDILEPLRAKNVLVQAGAKFITGLVGDIQVPILNAGQVAWEGETAEAPDAGYTFTSKKLSPKRLTAYVDISKQFLAQDSKGAEALIRQDLVNAINSKLESTILGADAGTATQPAGIFNGTLETVASYADVADFEATIEDANVIGECKYIMSNKAKAAYRTMQKGNGVGFVYENGAIDGTPVFTTSNVADKNVAYGDWSNLAIGQWSSINNNYFSRA